VICHKAPNIGIPLPVFSVVRPRSAQWGRQVT